MLIEERAFRVRLILFDVDGVLTDGTLIVHADGSESKVFDIKDGTGIVWAQRLGLTVGFLSARSSAATSQRAAQLGFDTIWIPDHFYMERPTKLETYPDAWTLLSAIGVTTERVRLGTQVIAAGFRHPALLAKMAGALQELSGGRLLLGIGAGNQAHEHNAFGFDFDRRIGRFKEYLAILTALLNGETVTLEGRYYSLHEASLRTAVPKVPLLMCRIAKGTTNVTLAGFEP